MNDPRVNESAPPIRVPNVGGTASLPTARAVAAWRCRWPAVAALGKLEAQRTRHRVCVGQSQGQALAHAIRFAAGIADQCPGSLVVAEIFLAQVLGEDQAVAAQ